MAVSNPVENFMYTYMKRVGIARWFMSFKFLVYSFVEYVLCSLGMHLSLVLNDPKALRPEDLFN